MLLLEDEPTARALTLGTNAFRGVISPVNGAEGLLFPGLQLASVNGGAFSHTWRITNVRVNTQTLGAVSSVQATVSIAATVPFSVSWIGSTSVAVLSSASRFSVLSATAGSGQTIQPVSFTEGFPTAFEPRLAAGQDPSQAGTVYNSESGYVNTAVLGAQTGFATNGTRLITAIGNVPAGVSVYAPVGPASGTSAQLVSADGTGAGGFPVAGTNVINGITYQPITLTAGAGTATWEVVASDPTSVETLMFNLLLANPNAVSLAGISYAGALAPVSSGAAPQLPSTSLGVPRFASGSIVLAPPATVSLSIAPQQVPQVLQGSALKPSLRSAASTPAVGGTVSWTQVQANTGSSTSATAHDVSVGGTLPPTWVLTSCVFVDSQGTCTINPNSTGNQFTATYPSLSPGQTTTMMLTAQSPTQSTGTVEYTSSINSDSGNTDTTSDAFTTNFPVATIGLNVSLTHATNFTQGQIGTQYSLTVTNGGSLATTNPVVVTEMIPAGLTLVSMAGTAAEETLWELQREHVFAQRIPLQKNTSYDPIKVTVNVAPNAPATVINQVTVTSGVLQATGSDTTNINTGTGTSPTVSKVGIFRSGFFWLLDVDGNQQFNSPPDLSFGFGGVPGDIPITGDWTGNGHTKVGIYRPSNGLFLLDSNGDGQFDAGDAVYNLGVGTQTGDVPVVGDWNGDGRTKVGLFRQGFFWMLDYNGDGVFETGIDKAYAFGGVAGDVPVVGDWSGTGTSKIGLFRQGFFWILDYNGNGTVDNVNGTGGDKAFAYGGIAGDVPVVGDWNGSGTSKVGVFREGFFWVLDANGNDQFDGVGPGQDLAFAFGGISGDIPVVGKW